MKFEEISPGRFDARTSEGPGVVVVIVFDHDKESWRKTTRHEEHEGAITMTHDRLEAAKLDAPRAVADFFSMRIGELDHEIEELATARAKLVAQQTEFLAGGGE